MAKTKDKAYYESRPLKLDSRGGYADPAERAFWAERSRAVKREMDAASKLDTKILVVGGIGIAGAIAYALFGRKH